MGISRKSLSSTGFLQKKDTEIEDSNAFLFAVRKPDLKFWRVDQFGNLHDPEEPMEMCFQFECLGSGKEKADVYVKSLVDDEEIDSEAFTIPEAARKIAYNGLQKASFDISTGGPPDIVVLTKNVLSPYGKDFRDGRMKSDEGVLGKIEEEFGLETSLKPEKE